MDHIIDVDRFGIIPWFVKFDNDNLTSAFFIKIQIWGFFNETWCFPTDTDINEPDIFPPDTDINDKTCRADHDLMLTS